MNQSSINIIADMCSCILYSIMFVVHYICACMHELK